MKCTKGFGGRGMNVALNYELIEEVESFKYLGSKKYCRWRERDDVQDQ